MQKRVQQFLLFQMADFVKNAMDSVANWNKQMNQERKEKRTAFFDMQVGSDETVKCSTTLYNYFSSKY